MVVLSSRDHLTSIAKPFYTIKFSLANFMCQMLFDRVN